MKNRSHRHNINRYRNGHKYSIYKKYLTMMALTYLTWIYIHVFKILRFREILGPFAIFNL